MIDLHSCNYLSLTERFFIQISIIYDNISSQVIDKRKQGFGQWINSSIIHDNICKLVHEKCHLRSCHGDIKYHMTLNMIFSVLLVMLFLMFYCSYLILEFLDWYILALCGACFFGSKSLKNYTVSVILN